MKFLVFYLLISFLILISLKNVFGGAYWLGNAAQMSTWHIQNVWLRHYNVTDDPKGGDDKVIRVNFPKGSVNAYGGGIGFSVFPFPKMGFLNVTLEYDLYIPPEFEWVLGGKLPGLAGNLYCGGGSTAMNCFSARFMWAPKGDGFVYLYIPKDAPHLPEFCQLTNYKDCNRYWAFDFNKTHYFVRDKWLHIKEKVALNTVGEANGLLQVWVDDEIKADYNKIIWRVSDDIKINSIQLEIFFGGDGEACATPVSTSLYLKNFKFYEN